MIKLVGILAIMLPCVITDIRSKRVPAYYILTCGLCALLLNLVYGWESIVEMLIGILIGVIFILMARMSNETIGYGDGILIAAMGIWCGGTALISVMLISLIAAAVYGMVLIALKKGNRRMRIPFAPFLAAGGIANWLLTIGSVGL